MPVQSSKIQSEDFTLLPNKSLGRSRLRKTSSSFIRDNERPGHHRRTDSSEKEDSPVFSLSLYVWSLPQLFMGCLGLLGTIFLFQFVRPESIANVGGEKVYLPVLFCTSWASFWLFGYFAQHWRRAIWFTSIICAWLILRLQERTLFPQLFIFAGALIFLEMYLTKRRARG